MQEYPWYVQLEADNELQQGDFIPDCPIVIPPERIVEGGLEDIVVEYIDTIVLSQSCDLVNGKIDIVLVCPYYPLQQFLDQLPEDQKNKKGLKRAIDNLKRGALPAYHLLNKDSALFEDHLVVDFKNVYGIRFQALTDIVKSIQKRVRLLPPYREHLSQAFARYFMRVGLPQDIQIEGY
jgi:hypothetical protein